LNFHIIELIIGIITLTISYLIFAFILKKVDMKIKVIIMIGIFGVLLIIHILLMVLLRP